MKNCWEYWNCGREPGGKHIQEMGVCPAAVAVAHNGKNDGINAGRVCWAVSGTHCKGEIQGTVAHKIDNCLACEFFQYVSSQMHESRLSRPS